MEFSIDVFPEEIRPALIQLIKKCEAAKVKYDVLDLFGPKMLSVKIPGGRETRAFWVTEKEEADTLSGLIGKFVYVQGYEAISSYEDNTVEVYLKTLQPASRRRILSVLLNTRIEWKPEDKEQVEPVFQVQDGPVSLSLGKPSHEIQFLCQDTSDESGVSLNISGIEVNKNDEAQKIVAELVNSFLFSLRATKGIALMPRLHNRPTVSRRFFGDTKHMVSFPKYKYDLEALNLYWHGVSAYQMPLLQFLCFYQVLEFYFPIYSESELHKEIVNILKDPHFDRNDKIDISKLISVVSDKSGKGYGDEKNQMRATLRGCLRKSELEEVLGRKEMKEHFKTDFKKLSLVKISLEDREYDIRDQLSDRLYDIRCRVVHTKASESVRERILPFSEEENLLRSEVGLVEFAARKALIAASTALEL